MKLAVVSDSHDNVWKVRGAISKIQTAGALVHCGDLCSPFMVKEFGEPLPDLPIHIVWGNNEGDRLMISRVAESYPNVHLHGDLAEIEFDGYRIAVNHYPHIAASLARSGLYDLVCFGHNHQPSDEAVGGCLLVNPGDLMGYKNPSSFCFVDTETGAIERVTVG